jgi:hypothetical protein
MLRRWLSSIPSPKAPTTDKRRLHYDFDPGHTGSEDGRLAVFQSVLDELRTFPWGIRAQH